jgi:Kef-type K+ transport system membrane component KefB
MISSLSEEQLLLTLVAVAVILLLARTAGELARRLRQPEVLGELLAGFLLGPSVFGALLPGAFHTLFLTDAVGLVLSGFSWVGAILLLLVSGLEVVLTILRTEIKPGTLAAAFAILPSLGVGVLFGHFALGIPLLNGFMLGIVLSVTAVGVLAKILIEREALRRRYAQVMLAAGIASEVLVWVLISFASSMRNGTLVSVGISVLSILGFFLVMLSLGRRFTFWAMRRVTDLTGITYGQVSLVLVLTFLAASVTQRLGLHALLGAFVFGVLLSRAPRATESLTESLQTMTTGLFAPIFFALAGMRVNMFQLGRPSAIGTVLLLLAVASLVKVGSSALGARLGGVPVWESLLVGVGLNLKGGTDVIVAILGTELGLFSNQTYTLYTMVAILTVLISPVLLRYLARRAPPGQKEQARLVREEADRHAYMPRIERVLVPITPPLLPAMVSAVVERMARAKHEEGQIFDITELVVEAGKPEPAPTDVQARHNLDAASGLKEVELTQQRVDVGHEPVTAILDAVPGHALLAIGAHSPSPTRFTFGHFQDDLIHRAPSHVLVVIGQTEIRDWSSVRRILVPTNGLEPAMAAGDLAAALAKSCDAELVVFHVVESELNPPYWRGRERDQVREAAVSIVEKLAGIARRLGVRVSARVAEGRNPGEAILAELNREPYQLVALGGIDRGTDDRLFLGRTIQTVLTEGHTPAILLVSHVR